MNYKTSNIKDGKEVLISGSFTFRDHDTFFEIVAMIKTGYDKHIVLNMADCDFLDSAALGMLVIAHDEAASKGVDLSIKGVKGKVKDVIIGANAVVNGKVDSDSVYAGNPAKLIKKRFDKEELKKSNK